MNAVDKLIISSYQYRHQIWVLIPLNTNSKLGSSWMNFMRWSPIETEFSSSESIFHLKLAHIETTIDWMNLHAITQLVISLAEVI